MSTEDEIKEIVSRYTRAADRRDGAAMAALYEADAVVGVQYHGPDGIDDGEVLGSLSGAEQIGAAVTTAMAPHPPLGWSHHTTYDHLVTVDGDEASIETQFITFNVVGTRKPRRVGAGWLRASGAQGTIKPIESGYYRFTFRGPTEHGASAIWASYTTSPASGAGPAARGGARRTGRAAAAPGGGGGRVACRHLRRPGHHHANRVRVLRLRLPADRRRVAHQPPGRHTRHPHASDHRAAVGLHSPLSGLRRGAVEDADLQVSLPRVRPSPHR